MYRRKENSCFVFSRKSNHGFGIIVHGPDRAIAGTDNKKYVLEIKFGPLMYWLYFGNAL